MRACTCSCVVMDDTDANLKLKFASFHAQNIDVVNEFTARAPSHPIDRVELELWRDEMLKRLGDGRRAQPSMVEFVTRFAKQLRHVPMHEFLFYHRHIISDLVKYLQEEKAPEVILTFHDKGAKSSGMWMALLAWISIAPYVTHVMTPADAGALIQRENAPRCIIIYMDDCAYSGNQIGNDLRTIFANYVDNRNGRVTFVPAIPFMTDMARDRINMWSIGTAWFCYYIQTLYPLYEEDELELTLFNGGADTTERWFWQDYFEDEETHDRIPNHAPVYFDFKLADGMSTYTKIISKAPLIPPYKSDAYNKRRIEYGKGFIRGCDNSDIQCPFPLYKRVTYTWKGETPIMEPDRSTLSYLKVNAHMCAQCGAASFHYAGDYAFCGTRCYEQWYPLI